MENVLNIKIDRKSYMENTKWDLQISKIICRFFSHHMKMYNFFYTILYSRAVDTRDMGKLIISSVNIKVIIFMGCEFESNYLILLSP